MWSFRAWRQRRWLARHPLDPALWQQVVAALPLLHGLTEAQLHCLAQRSLLFLRDKRLSCVGDLPLDDYQRLRLAAQAQLPLLALDDLDWYQVFHEIILYADDFLSPQRYRDSTGVEHQWDDARSGEAWLQGPVILAWPGVQESGQWHGYNLIIHELAHKLDMLNGDVNGLPPLHADMRLEDWSHSLQTAFDDLNAQLDADPAADTLIDPYAASCPGEFFAVCSEYFFSAPDLLLQAYPQVYRQLRLFYRQDPLQRLPATSI